MKRQTVLMLLVVVLGVAGLALVAGGAGKGGEDCVGTPETGACCYRQKHGASKGGFVCHCDIGVPCPRGGTMQAECCASGTECINDQCV
jgi:hypothetical protein